MKNINELNEFISASGFPPETLRKMVHEKISSILNPSSFIIFLKLVGIQIVVGTISLFVCPQFGFSFSSYPGIFHELHHISPEACMLACGMFFVGLGVLLSVFIFSTDEIRIFRKYKFIKFLLLGSLFLLLFHFVTREVLINLAVFWLIGGVLGGTIILEVGKKIKFGDFKIN